MSLGAGIAENAWYHLFMNISVINNDQLNVAASVSRFATPTNPNSPVVGLVGPPLLFVGSLTGAGLESEGEVGLAASAFSTNVNSSVTNFVLPTCRQP